MADVSGTRSTHYWIFQARPDVYSLAELLQPGSVEEWKLTRFAKKLGAGDFVHFWQAGSDNAVLGWGVVEDEPYPESKGSNRHRVPVRYEVRLSEPLTRTALRDDRWLWALSILRSPQGTNFAVTTEQALALNRMLRDQKQSAPPDPGPFLPSEGLLDGELSGTTERVIRNASKWTAANNGPVPALSSSLLLLAFAQIGLASKRQFLDTARFLALRVEEADELIERYLREWKLDPELAQVPETSYPPATLTAGLVLDAARRIAIATTGNSRVSLRHLLGALIESDTLAAGMGAHKRLEQAGVEIPGLRRDFIGYLRDDPRQDSIGAWEEVLLASNERISLLASYHSDRPEGDDKLEIGTEVNALASLVAAQAVKPPLSIGLFGDWGAGKSFFMKKMIDRVSWICRRTPEDADPATTPFYRNIIQIEFNAWHYSESNIWASLVTHIFDNLRLAVEEESDKDTVEKRRELILAELEELEKLREQADSELKAARRTLAGQKSAFTRAERTAQKRSEALESVRKRNVLDALTLTPSIEALFTRVQEALGLEQVARDAREVYKAVQQVYTVGGQSRAFWLSVLNSEGWRGRLLWLGGVLVCFVILSLVVNSSWFDTSNELWQEIRTFVVGLVSLLGVGAGWLRKHLNSAQEALDLLRKADTEFSQQIEMERQKILVDLDAKRLELEEQLKKVDDARRNIQQAEQAVAEKQAELDDLEPDRLLARFIEERALSDDYRKELGILSLIRKDFERLERFLSRPHSGENAKFLAIDRIILYIDDLDRCPEDRVIKVLQAVHLLLAFELFVVIVAVDARWIRQSLVKRYGDLLQDDRPHLLGSEEQVRSNAATSEDYLEKIFQIPFWIKPMGETGARALVQDLLERDLQSAVAEAGDDSGSERGGETRGALAGGAPDEDDASGGMEPGGRGRQDGVKPEVPYDPNWLLEPQRLTLDRDELAVIEQLAPIIGRSPRAVKRFVNVYRILRAGLHRDELATFLGENKETPRYPAALLLLAILNGSPSLATHVFHELSSGEVKETFEAFVDRLKQEPGRATESEWSRLFEFLTPFMKDWGRQLKVGLLQEWAPRVARYSFRTEMATE